MLQQDYILRLIREFMAALAKALEKKEFTARREELRQLYNQYVGPYSFYFTAPIDDVFDAIGQEEEQKRLPKLEMLAELYYAEADLVSLPDRERLLQNAFTIFNYVDMTVGRPGRNIIRFALPLIGGYILQQMYLIIDAAIVGRWIGVEALAAVGASSSIMFLIMGFCNGACAGFSIPVAQRFGAKDFRQRILKVVNTPHEILHDAWVYLLFQFLAIPFTIGYNLLAGFIRAVGNSRQPFLFVIAASVFNTLLDIILILWIGMGVEGAALATLLAQAFAFSLCLHYIIRDLRMLIPANDERRYDDHLTGRLLNSGIPMGLQFSITGIGIIMLQSANNALGTVYVAAFTASMRVKYLFTCVFENIGAAMTTYCGQNIGAGEIRRVALGVKSAIKIMLVYFVFTFLIIWPFADEMMLLFVDADNQVIVSSAAQFMRIANYFYPVLGLLTILRYSIQGLGFSNLSMLSGVMEMIARCGVSLWLVPALGFLGVCFGDPIAWIAADLFLVPAYLYVYRRLKVRTGV